MVTAVLGPVLDAWDEVRVHRSRVVLSLVGIVLAVFAMTVTTAAGMIFGQIVRQSAEASVGRDATIRVSAMTKDGAAAPAAFYDSLVARYGVRYHSRVMYSNLPGTEQAVPPGGELPPEGEAQSGALDPWQLVAVDPDYDVIHRLVIDRGRWLTADDKDLLAPSVVVNRKGLEALGQDPQRPMPFTVALPGDEARSVVVVGVTSRDEYLPAMFTLIDDLPDIAPTAGGGSLDLELWVPPERSEQLTDEIDQLIRDGGLTGSVAPSEIGGFDVVLRGLQALIFAMSVFALILGALGVLNVGVVTVRQRVREIGVRRALGASSVRIFCAVMLESVLATMLAGLLGIAMAVAVINLFPYQLLPDELAITEDVPFPVGAALQAFVAATVIGALVGLVPATIAVRAKVIDAIRF